VRHGQGFVLEALGISKPSHISSCRGLTHIEALHLQTLLHRDALDGYYSALVSFADALHGLQANYFSWATVKLYYALFYCLRALLSGAGVCIFYLGSAPALVQAIAGDRPARASATPTSACCAFSNAVCSPESAFSAYGRFGLSSMDC